MPSSTRIGLDRRRRLRILVAGRRPGATARRLLPGSTSPPRARGRPRPGAAPSPKRSPLAAAAAGGSTFSGLGFDTCSAPSTATMSAWSASPYRAVGVYLGGANSACVQPSLTAGWVRGEVGAGWHLIPIYVGLQAPSTSCQCATITPAHASAQGGAAAADAISRADALGIGPGNPIYFDMEAYGRGSGSSAVLAFLAAWTKGLHASGYSSGVYSSGASGIADLVDSADSSYAEPDDIWVADWNGKPTTSDSYLPASLWDAHQRIHQYRGGHSERYGGVTISIDNDAVDGDVVGASAGGGGAGGGGGGAGPSFVNALSLIKTRHTSGTVGVHLDSLEGGSFGRALDADSDFRSRAAEDGRFQLFGEANGAPELGYIKLRHTGRIEVRWDTLQDGSYRRAGSFSSDFRAAQRRNGQFQLFAGAGGAPRLGFVKLRDAGSRIGVRWDVLRGRSYRRAGSFSSDFRPSERGNGRWQLFGGAGGAPRLGFVKLRHGGGQVTVHWDALRRGRYRRIGDFRTEFPSRAGRNGVWQLIAVSGGAPELAFVKLRSTRGSVEGHWELLQGSGFKAAGDAGSDFSPTEAGRGVWQLSPY